MADALKPLEALIRMVLDAELARLRRLSDEVAARTDAIRGLADAQAARAAEVAAGADAEDLAFRSGRDAQWHHWVATTRLSLSQQAAEAAARREAQRRVAERAFGRVEALAGLRAREAEERRKRAARSLQT